MAYRILIWSGPQARLVDHEPIAGGADDALLDRLAAAGRAALGLPPRGSDMRGKIACVHRHLARAAMLLEEL